MIGLRCSTCDFQVSTFFYGMCAECFEDAIERAEDNTHRVTLLRLNGQEYMPLGLNDIGSRVAVGTILGMPHWPAARPIALVVNGFQLHPSLPIGLFPPEDVIHCLFDASSLFLATAEVLSSRGDDLPVVNESLYWQHAEVQSRPCADLCDVHTPPTPSPR